MEPPPSLFPSKLEFFRLLLVIFIASSVAISCHYFTSFLHRPPKPFCDSDFHDPYSDNCEPCPSHGECYDGRLECVSGFRKHGKICVEDGEINEKAKMLAERVECYVCEGYAMYQCGGGYGRVWAHEDEVWNDLDENKLMEDLSVDRSILGLIKLKAALSLDRLLEIKTDSLGVKKVKCPDWLAERYKPFPCRLREWLSKHASVLTAVSALLVGCTLLFRKISRRRYLSKRADELYEQICDILEEQALISRGINREDEPWVVSSWLRDHLLLPKERKDPVLWKRVEDLVQEDSRLDRYPRLVKGESKVVWEWQVGGSVGSLSKRRKRTEGIVKPCEGVKPHIAANCNEPLRC